jgi:hypothetical protein
LQHCHIEQNSLNSHVFTSLIRRYEGQKHSSQGYFILFIAVLLSAFDVIALVGRSVAYVNGVRSGQDQFTLLGCWRAVVLDRAEDRPVGNGAEYVGLVSADSEEMEAAELKAREIEGDDVEQTIQERRAHFVAPINTDYSPRMSHDEDDQWANDHGHHRHHQRSLSAASEHTVFEHSPRGSVHSDETLHESAVRSSWKGLGRMALLKKVGRAVFATAERSLVFAGLFQVTTGIVVYTGGCRENYINGCLAHLISAYLKPLLHIAVNMDLIISSFQNALI